MPLIDVRCLTCATVSEVMRPLSQWPSTPACPRCDAATEQIHLPSGRSTAPAVVAYQMPDGTYRFPGRSESLATRKYEAEGGTRIELRGWQQIRPFEAKVNDIERRKIAARLASQQRHQEAGTRARRSDLYNAMKGMSDGAKSYARHLIRVNDAKKPLTGYDPGFRVEAYSESRSNREEARDDRGRRTRD